VGFHWAMNANVVAITWGENSAETGR